MIPLARSGASSSQIHTDGEQNRGYQRTRGLRSGGYCLMDIEFQFEVMKKVLETNGNDGFATP